jgi:dTDP-4-amino-4,6-dideoxygalactose transaminase
MTYTLPFNRPSIAGNELRYVEEALRGRHWCGDGEFTRRSARILESEWPGSRVLLTTSCTHALEMAAMLLDLGPGDEVLLPSFTFVSTANAIALRAARPVFVDIRADTLNIDEHLLTAAMTPRTRAIFVVHYAGVPCEMDAIAAVAQEHGLAVVEDNAHGLFGRYKDRALGGFGQLSTLSFHETKNLSCGEGGALVVNDPSLVERAEVLREKGTDRSRFFRGQVDKYTWVDVGSSYLPSDVLSAVLLAQLECRAAIQAQRKALWDRYFAGLQQWAVACEVRLPFVPAQCEHPAHLFWIVLPSRGDRDNLIAYLKTRGIMSVFHYLPLHTSAVGRQYGHRPGDLPVTEQVSDRLLRLPLFHAMTAEQAEQVIDAVTSWTPASAGARSC